MVRRQTLAVLHVPQDDVTRRVHRDLVLNTGPVLGPTATWQILSALKAHVQGPTTTAEDPAPLEHIAQQYAAPHRRGDSCGPPVEPDGLLHHVLLFASVTGADQRHRELMAPELVHQLVHGEPGGSFYEPADLKGPVLPPALGNRTVVPHVVERDRGDEPVLHEPGQGRFRVEGMLPCEADHGSVALDPTVGRGLISGVTDRRLQFTVPFLYQLYIILLIFVLAGRIFPRQDDFLGNRRDLTATVRRVGPVAVGNGFEGANVAVDGGLETSEPTVLH